MRMPGNSDTVMYWKEGDLVRVYFQHMNRTGVLDGWSHWPERRHHDPYPCDFTGVCMWPVRVRNFTHQHIAIDRVDVFHCGAYIIANRSLDRRAGVIQRHWRLHHERRVAAARAIQCAWKECVSDPYRCICRKRLLHEFAGLVALCTSHS